MANYYGVIGNRDYIKLGGERRPFWEFLDEQPDGWLTSLAYEREDTPRGRPMIWDCGAWSYKAEDVPRLGKNLVTPEWTIAQYARLAQPGDLVIAPDHMLIPGMGDLDARRAFNRASADAFLPLARAAGLRAMATMHGATTDERIHYAEWLAGLGYDALAIGGLAGQASRREVVVNAVIDARDALPDMYLHVLGLSSPSYAQTWEYLRINSFDGSSHFKQAFTAGVFYTSEGADLTKHQAARAGEDVTAPSCDCRACALLRAEGVDTRRYGSNETNMGRAAHNLNHLIRALNVARGR